jgi:hypothetical protein
MNDLFQYKQNLTNNFNSSQAKSSSNLTSTNMNSLFGDIKSSSQPKQSNNNSYFSYKENPTNFFNQFQNNNIDNNSQSQNNNINNKKEEDKNDDDEEEDLNIYDV